MSREAAQVGNSDYFPFWEEDGNIPCVAISRSPEIPPDGATPPGCSLWLHSSTAPALASPHPLRALAAANSIPHPSPSFQSCFPPSHFGKSSRDILALLSQQYERTQRELCPAAAPLTHTQHLPFLHAGKGGLQLKSAWQILVKEPCKV